MMRRTASLLPLLFFIVSSNAQNKRVRDIGLRIGVMSPGKLNAITDVAGVQVGHVTIVEGDSVRTGITAIIPHSSNLFQQKVPAAVYVGNGFGKLTGTTQIKELGNLETPVILTNTLSVAAAVDALVDYTLTQKGNENVQSVSAVVGETNDGYLNDIRGRHVKKEQVLQAIAKAAGGPVQEGAIGAGTGTICFGFKGGIGTASRKLPALPAHRARRALAPCRGCGAIPRPRVAARRRRSRARARQPVRRRRGPSARSP